jgi:hypothetical protein
VCPRPKTTSNLPQSNSRAQAAVGYWAEFKINIISNIWLCSRQHTGRDGTSSLINKVHAQPLTDFKICKRYGCPVYTKRAAVYGEFTTADKFWSMCLTKCVDCYLRSRLGSTGQGGEGPKTYARDKTRTESRDVHSTSNTISHTGSEHLRHLYNITVVFILQHCTTSMHNVFATCFQTKSFPTSTSVYRPSSGCTCFSSFYSHAQRYLVCNCSTPSIN